MTGLFRVTAPLVIRYPDGTRRVMAECFRHPRGILFFDLYWHRKDPGEAAHVVEGDILGEGPWRVGTCVVSVLGCHGSDSELAARYANWQHDLEQADDYPPPPLVAAIARKLGAGAPPSVSPRHSTTHRRRKP